MGAATGTSTLPRGAGRLRADDGRGCLWVDTVRLTYLDLGEASVCECRRELLAGERPGDAAGPLLHVRARGGIHALIGDHVRDRETSAGAQHPRDLAQNLWLVAGEVQHAV